MNQLKNKEKCISHFLYRPRDENEEKIVFALFVNSMKIKKIQLSRAPNLTLFTITLQKEI